MNCMGLPYHHGKYGRAWTSHAVEQRKVSHFWPDCKPEGPLFSAEFACLSVCLWPALLPFIVDRFWWNLVTRTLLWSSLATTIMVQIGRRGTPRRLFENFEKFSKITEFECQNSGPSFFASVSSVYTPFPQIDIIGAVVIVWRVRGKTVRSVLCNTVCNNCAQCDADTYEQT